MSLDPELISIMALIANDYKKYIDRKTAIAEKIVAMAIEGYYPAMRDIVETGTDDDVRDEISHGECV